MLRIYLINVKSVALRWKKPDIHTTVTRTSRVIQIRLLVFFCFCFAGPVQKGMQLIFAELAVSAQRTGEHLFETMHWHPGIRLREPGLRKVDDAREGARVLQGNGGDELVLSRLLRCWRQW